MRYSVAAFVIQIIALLCGLVALGLASYVFHYDRQWYNIVQLHGHIYFETFVTRTLVDMYRATQDIFPYGGFEKHHRIRTNPPDYFASNFLRHTKSPEIIFMALLVLTGLMQLCALAITCARKVRFLPRPCRENGSWYIIIGIICTTASIIELQSRLEINSFYATFQRYTNSANADEQMGAIMLASCGGRGWQVYESQLTILSKLGERDSLYVCQRFWFFVAAVTLEFLCALLCLIIAIILCCFWKKKTHVDQADAESLDRENNNDPLYVNQEEAKQNKPILDENKNPNNQFTNDVNPNFSELQEEEEIMSKTEIDKEEATGSNNEDKNADSFDDNDQNKTTGSNDPMTTDKSPARKKMDETTDKSENKKSLVNKKKPKNKKLAKIPTKKKGDKGGI